MPLPVSNCHVSREACTIASAHDPLCLFFYFSDSLSPSLSLPIFYDSPFSFSVSYAFILSFTPSFYISFSLSFPLPSPHFPFSSLPHPHTFLPSLSHLPSPSLPPAMTHARISRRRALAHPSRVLRFVLDRRSAVMNCH